jgi:hypothetical protein
LPIPKAISVPITLPNFLIRFNEVTAALDRQRRRFDDLQAECSRYRPWRGLDDLFADRDISRRWNSDLMECLERTV